MSTSSSSPFEAIKRQIDRAATNLIEQRTGGGAGEEDEIAVLFTGNWHDSIPRRLIVDDVLSPVEKITWQVIRLSVVNPSQPGSAPRRADLARHINCSAPTVTNSRNMLRIQRWMTFCKAVRKQGRFVGEIYLLHDEPFSLATTLEVDPSYIEFLEKTASNGNKNSSLRKAAATELKAIDALRGDIKPVNEVEQIVNRISWVTAREIGYGAGPGNEDTPESHHGKILSMVSNPASTTPLVNKKPDQAATKETPHHGKILSMVEVDQKTLQSKILSPVNTPENHQRKNLSMVENDQSKILSMVEKSVSQLVCSSSLYINKNINAQAGAHMQAHTGTQALVRVDEAIEIQSPQVDQLEQFDQVELCDLDEFEADMLAAERGFAELESPADTGGHPASAARKTGEEGFDAETFEDLMDYRPQHAHYEDLELLVKTYLPDIASPRISEYVRYLLVTRKAQIPRIARMVKPLPPLYRRHVLFQLVSKAAADRNGWSKVELGNLASYCGALVASLKRGDFYMDEFATTLLEAVVADREPYIPTTAEKREQWQYMNLPDGPDYYKGKHYEIPEQE